MKRGSYGSKGKKPFRYSDAYRAWKRAVVEYGAESDQAKAAAAIHSKFLEQFKPRR